MSEETINALKSIKQSFRLRMNGDISRSMREKGMDYKLNWGISIIELKQMGKEIGQNYDLAVELWKENIRECKILATMIMPPAQMMPELVDIWMEQTPNIEIAEQAAFNLYQHLDFAPVFAFEWIASENTIYQICGYQLISHLLKQNKPLDERGINELIDQSLCALQGQDLSVSRAAANCLRRLSETSETHEQIVEQALKSVGLELF